jgi:hypothetical protein
MQNWETPARHAATVALALLTLASGGIFSQGAVQPRSTTVVNGQEAAEGEVIVRYRDNIHSLQRAHAEFTVSAERGVPIGGRGLRRMRSRGMTTRQMIEVLRANPDVEFVEPNYRLRLNALPNDPNMIYLWGMFNQGQNIGGTPGLPGADIKANLAWNFTTGSRDTVVGVIDTGVDYNHPDLNANMWRAPRSFQVTIGGVTITCGAGTYGFNAITRTCDPMDDNAHGTHVAGTIGAVGHNGIGVAGVNWTASMMALKFLNWAGEGWTSDAIDAIEFAIQAKGALGADANVRVLSNSWGGISFSQALREQIDRAATFDILFVAAAGNRNANADVSPDYPAAYPSPNIISVASTSNRDERSSFSNYGATSVDLGAPGGYILSTVPGGGYAFMSGTSMATPHVAGAAALLLSACNGPTDLLKTWLLSSVDPIAALSGITTTGGRLNLDAAMQLCLDFNPTIDASIAGNTITVNIANGPARPRDWVALYCPSSNPDGNYSAFRYLNNSTSPPSTGITSASVTFPAPSGPSTCNARFFYNGGMLKLGTSNPVTFNPLPPAISLAATSVNPGGTISVTVANGPGNPTDWLALWAQGAPQSAHMQWRYMNNSQTPPSAGITGVTSNFIAPSAPGTYEVRWLASNGSTRIATSPPITVVGQPSLSINDVSVTEGNTGTASATFSVTMNPANLSQTVTVNYATADWTATTANNDYVAANGTLTFAPGETSKLITVSINGDTTIEANENFYVNLSGATNALLADPQGVGIIASDDLPPGPAVTVAATSVAPGGTIAFTVLNSPGNALDWITLTPTTGADGSYTRWMYLNGLQTPPQAGTTSATLQFPAPTVPGTYDVRLFANNRLAKLATSAPVLVATQPMLSIGDVSVTEGNSGTSVATIAVTLSPLSSQPVSVEFATSDGTATTAGNDYGAATGTLTFAPGVGTQTISVVINGDTAIEATEMFNVNLSSPVNAPIADAQGVVTITSDDVPAGPAVTLAQGSVSPNGRFQVSISGGPGNPTDWVTITPVGSPDGAYADWFYLNGLKTPPAAGLPSATVSMTAPPTMGTYDVRLFANNRLTRLATSGPLTVSNGPALSINDVAVSEGNAGTVVATFTVTLAPVSSQTVTVGYATADSSATTANGDYLAASGTLSFAPSESTKTIAVTINGDTAIEGTEAFFVSLGNAVNATLADEQGIGSIVNDDVPAGPSVSVNVATVAPGGAVTVTVAGGPANRLDWVAVVPATAADNSYGDWKYLNNSRSAPASGAAEATVQITAPTTPGTYNVRFFANNVLNRLATSATFIVQ